MTVEELRTKVKNILESDYGFDFEEAETAVNTAYNDDPERWNENSDSEDLAAYIASDEFEG